MTKLQEGDGQGNLGSELQSLERKWSSKLSTRKNLVEQLGQIVDPTDNGDISLTMVSIESGQHSATRATGEAPNNFGQEHLSSSVATLAPSTKFLPFQIATGKRKRLGVFVFVPVTLYISTTTEN